MHLFDLPLDVKILIASYSEPVWWWFTQYDSTFTDHSQYANLFISRQTDIESGYFARTVALLFNKRHSIDDQPSETFQTQCLVEHEWHYKGKKHRFGLPAIVCMYSNKKADEFCYYCFGVPLENVKPIKYRVQHKQTLANLAKQYRKAIKRERELRKLQDATYRKFADELVRTRKKQNEYATTRNDLGLQILRVLGLQDKLKVKIYKIYCNDLYMRNFFVTEKRNPVKSHVQPPRNSKYFIKRANHISASFRILFANWAKIKIRVIIIGRSRKPNNRSQRNQFHYLPRFTDILFGHPGLLAAINPIAEIIGVTAEQSASFFPRPNTIPVHPYKCAFPISRRWFFILVHF